MEAGRVLAHYRLVEQIGEGGMGVVWKAVDTTLDREVAVKILPEAFASEAERLARFEREAKLLASLNHPNIATIHGLHRDGDVHFLVMELVPGENLDERLRRGPLTMDEALRVVRQVVDALEAAHENGVIHRDLKPANIHVTPDSEVKVLDFGLAKAMEPDPASGSDPGLSPTLTSAGTIAGTILGTAAYMSPEQARGHAADRRADLWALGCVLYEMLTAKRIFEGNTVSDTLAAVLRADPDWTTLPDDTSASIRRLLRRCLVKDRRQRLQAAGDARLEIEEAVFAPDTETEGSAPKAATPRWKVLLPWTLAVVMTVVALVAVWSPSSDSLSIAAPMRFTLPLEGSDTIPPMAGASVVLTPDGTGLVYVATLDGSQKLHYRALDSDDVVTLPGTEQGRHPFFSPDGRWVGFFADNELKKIPVQGGPPVRVAATKSDRGGTWGPDGTIYFAPTEESVILRASADGGAAEPVSTLAEDGSERSHRWPDLLPGGKALLIAVEEKTDTVFDDADIQVLDIASGVRRTVIQGGSYPRYVPSGHLVYVRAGTLLAAPFDLDRLEVTGPAVAVVESVQSFAGSGGVQLSFSSSGTMVYLPLRPELESTVVRIDLEGKRRVVADVPGSYNGPHFSPEGRRVVVSLDEDLWILDLERDVSTRLTFDAGFNYNPVWSPDGRRVVYSSRAGGLTNDNLHLLDAGGTGEPERIASSEYSQYPQSWSPDGRWLLYDHDDYETNTDILMLSMGEEHEERVFLRTSFDEGRARVSPDGRLVAYSSDESGRLEVYLRSFPEGEGKVQVSTAGGDLPLWAPDGRRLFYRVGDTVMEVGVKGEPELELGRPETFIEGFPVYRRLSGTGNYDYDIAPDGLELVFLQPATDDTVNLQPRVVVNWFDDLRRLSPQ